MRSFEETREIPCSAAKMFDVVMDIERYPLFLPWVAGATIFKKMDGELHAELIADLAGSQHSFKTVDRFIANKLVEIRLLEGPFRFLESIWTFKSMDENRCKVHFSIEFEFRNMMLDLVASPVFSSACRSMVAAFERRALSLREGV